MAKRKKKKKNDSPNVSTDLPVLFKCNNCNFEEQIPKEVVDYFDIIDGGDPSVPPRFNCQTCVKGTMKPVFYVNHDGIVYKN